MTEKVLILDFGSQYTQLIARAVREANVYCEIIPYHKSFEFTPALKGMRNSRQNYRAEGLNALKNVNTAGRISRSACKINFGMASRNSHRSG